MFRGKKRELRSDRIQREADDAYDDSYGGNEYNDDDQVHDGSYSFDEEHGHHPRRIESARRGPRHSSRDYKYRRALDEMGVNWTRLRRLDLRWMEKLWSFVDALQLFALIWSLSQPWPWPRPWLSRTRWTVVVNLDVVSITNAAMTVTGPGTESSPWGERYGYVYYATVFSLIPIGLQLMWHFRKVLTVVWLDRAAIFHRIVLGQGNTSRPPAARVVSALIAFERALLLSAHLLYLPVLLAVARLLICDADGTLSVDPDVTCRSAFVILPAMFGCGVVVIFTLDLRKHTMSAAHAITTYQYNSDHERFLQRVEMEYALNLCNAWEADHLWMVSSFRRHAVRHRLRVIYVKLVLGMIYAFGRSDLADQSVIFCGTMTAWCVWTCVHPPYRCRSSNRLYKVLYLTLWVDSFLGMMTGYGVRSAMLVARTQFRWLTAINLAGAVVALGVVLATPVEEAMARRRQRRRQLRALRQRREAARKVDSSSDRTDAGQDGQERGDEGKNDGTSSDTRLIDGDRTNGGGGGGGANLATSKPPGGSTDQDPSPETDTIAGPVRPDRWPTCATLDALACLPRRREWVEAIRRAKEFRFQCEMCPKGLEPIRSLEEFMRSVRVLWAEAKAEDSALEPALCSALERLSLVHARMVTEAGGRAGGLTSALEEALLDEGVRAGLRRRAKAQALMTDRMKRVMMKLLAITTFLNHRDLRDSSAASLARLRDDTDRALKEPHTSKSRACLKTICMQWKRLIQKTERKFQEDNGRPPTSSDKEKNSEWYECYRKLKAAIDNLPEDVTTAEQQRWPGQIVSPHRRAGVNAHVGRDYPESLALAPARSESLSNLIRASEHLLAIGGESVPLSNTEIVEVEACHKQWKRVIRRWEADFEKQSGCPPDLSDKQVVRSYYEYYGRLRSALPAKYSYDSV